jgi:hypothetical protein
MARTLREVQQEAGSRKQEEDEELKWIHCRLCQLEGCTNPSSFISCDDSSMSRNITHSS